MTADFPKVFDFKMVEGRDTCIATPGTALIPLSLAKKMFGEGGDYVGRKFGDNTSWYLVVGGVYEDFPKNSLLASNPVIQLPSPNIKERCEKDHSEISYRAYFKLDDPKNVDFFFRRACKIAMVA